jgi:pSer/pThr/pTyr-binding forkhead associated (FHA) protein
VAGGSVLSMSHEALDFSLWRGPFSFVVAVVKSGPDIHVIGENHDRDRGNTELTPWMAGAASRDVSTLRSGRGSRPLRQSMRVASIGVLPVSPRRVLQMEARFTVLSGPFRGQAFPIPRGKFILGREHDCHLVLDTNSVSRHHCVLLMDDNTSRIRDLASKNGTFVNRDLTRIGERVLAHGDRVRLGDLVIRVELESSAVSPSAASLETNDLGPETMDHPGHSPEKPKVDQPTSADASQKAAREA